MSTKSVILHIDSLKDSQIPEIKKYTSSIEEFDKLLIEQSKSNLLVFIEFDSSIDVQKVKKELSTKLGVQSDDFEIYNNQIFDIDEKVIETFQIDNLVKCKYRIYGNKRVLIKFASESEAQKFIKQNKFNPIYYQPLVEFSGIDNYLFIPIIAAKDTSSIYIEFFDPPTKQAKRIITEYCKNRITAEWNNNTVLLSLKDDDHLRKEKQIGDIIQICRDLSFYNYTFRVLFNHKKVSLENLDKKAEEIRTKAEAINETENEYLKATQEKEEQEKEHKKLRKQLRSSNYLV